MAMNAYDQYKQQTVMTMTHGEMLVKLFDEVLKQLNNAARNIEGKDVAAANLAMQKSQNILNYLRATLDMKYEVSQSLSSLYEFFIRQVIAANVRKDAAPLFDVIPMIGELKDTFTQAEKLARMSQQPIQAVSPGVISAIG